jgi:Putative peptidoglycan binding domain
MTRTGHSHPRIWDEQIAISIATQPISDIPYSRDPKKICALGSYCDMRFYPTMQLGKLVLVSASILGAAVPAMAVTHAHRGPTAPKLMTKRAAKPKLLSQRSIENDRATQIQTALIQSGYLSGTPSGHWDEQTEAAMTKLQADNGWQTKLVPDSRGLIKLGLGPSTAYNGAANQASVSGHADSLAPTAPLAQQ